MASMLESDPSSVSSNSSDESDNSDSVEIITDVMKASTLSRSQPRNIHGRKIATPSSLISTMAMKIANASTKAWDADLHYHDTLFSTNGRDGISGANSVHLEEIRTTPLFSADVLASVLGRQIELGGTATNVLPQYGLLAKVLETFNDKEKETDDLLGLAPPHLVNAFGEAVTAEGSALVKQTEDKRLFVNMNAPWSTFICGSQGSGKSHTLSCLLEDALIRSKLGKLPQPLAGMIFHYDKFTGFSSTQICEAAYIASTGISVKVLVSPSNLWRMTRAYQNLPGFPPNVKRPVVAPLLLHEKQLNVERMMKLMAVDEKDGKMALYMESVCRILRSIAMQNQNASGLNFNDFNRRINLETLNEGQKAMLNTRLELLRSFMYQTETAGNNNHQAKKPQFADTKKGREQERKWNSEDDAIRRTKIAKSNIWSFEPGTLTIVDLSCPFVDEGAACAMFNICLALFLEERQAAGRIVALDEAHKFMTSTSSSSQFTESLLSVIRQQRHLATRVIIATQEPTISPALLDLSSMMIVHRFTSPSWLAALKSHLAGVSSDGDASKRDVVEIFKRIVNLEAGEALLFSPSAMTGPETEGGHRGLRMQKLGTGYLKVRVRKRLTADGGRSILAT